MINNDSADGGKSATVDETKKKGWALILYDFKQKELILIKFLTLMFQGCKLIIKHFLTFYIDLFIFKSHKVSVF